MLSRDPQRAIRHSGADAATPEQGDPEQHDGGPTRGQGGTAAMTEPSLRAALLALGIGLVWAALSRGRRHRPTDLW